MSSDLIEFIHELAILHSPQSSQRTQSIAAIIFASFAFFAVRILYFAVDQRTW